MPNKDTTHSRYGFLNATIIIEHVCMKDLQNKQNTCVHMKKNLYYNYIDFCDEVVNK